MAIWDPKEESITHINVYSNSCTPLGRALSNFAHFPFVHPEYGRFESVESFYYWLLTGQEHDELKGLWGLKAKTFGMSLPVKAKVDKKFKEQIQYAIGLKVLQHSYIKDLIMHSTLPFTHYYYFGEIGKNPAIKDMYREHKYMIEGIELIRMSLKKSYNVLHKRTKTLPGRPKSQRDLS
jgi:hypothetical protein